MPQRSTWWLAAEIARRVRRGGGYDKSLAQASFQNDMLIAATCRQVGATLITANTRDVETIKRIVGVRYVTSFPAL